MRERALLGLMALVLAGAGVFLWTSLGDGGDDLKIEAGSADFAGDETVIIGEEFVNGIAPAPPAELRSTSRQNQVAPELGHHSTIVFLDHFGQVVPGLPVRLQDANNEDAPPTRLRETDAEGRVTFRKLPEGSSYFVDVQSITHYLRGSLRVLALPEPHEITAVALPFAVVAGEIKDEAGEPQKGIIVGMVGAENVRTDAAGRFRMTRVREAKGTRKLVALSRMAEFAASTEVPAIEAGTKHEGYLMMLSPSGRLEGTVSDYRSDPLGDVAIRVPMNKKKYAQPWGPVLTAAAENGAFRFEGNHFEVSTDRQGKYSIPLPWATNYRSLARKEKWFCRGGWARVEALAHGETRRQDFVMNQGGALAGKLVWPGEIPTEGTVVVTARGTGKKGRTRTNRIEPGEDWYIDGLPAGQYAVRVTYEAPVNTGSPFAAGISDDGGVFFSGRGGNTVVMRGGTTKAALEEALAQQLAEMTKLSSETRAGLRSGLVNPGNNVVLGRVPANTANGMPQRYQTLGNREAPIVISGLQVGRNDLQMVDSNELGLTLGDFRNFGVVKNETVYIGEISGVDVALDASQDDLTVSLTDVVVVRGVVRDQMGRPAPEVKVALRQYTSFSPRDANVTTDEEGRFEVRGWSAGRYRIQVYGDNYLNRGERKFELYAGDARDEDFVLERGLTVTGVVIGADGQPAARVNVWLNQSSSQSATTNKNGEFRFAKVRPGRARLYTRAGGKSGQDFSDRREIEIAGDVNDARLVLERSHVIEGLLLDREGRPRAKVKVTAQARDNNGLKRTGTTDAQGRFAIRGCYPGPYTVSATSASPAKRTRRNKKRRRATTAVTVDVSRSGAPFLTLRDR